MARQISEPIIYAAGQNTVRQDNGLSEGGHVKAMEMVLKERKSCCSREANLSGAQQDLQARRVFHLVATPVYRKDEKDVSVWNSVVALTELMCWKVVAKTQQGLNSLYIRSLSLHPATWNVRLRIRQSVKWGETCHGIVLFKNVSPSFRLRTPIGLLFGLKDVYLGGLGIDWSSVRNVTDMTANHGGFVATLINMPLWVMNVIPIHEPVTLSIIFDRGLIGYLMTGVSPSTLTREHMLYDLLHSTFLFSNLPNRCDVVELAAEIDCIVRPSG